MDISHFLLDTNSRIAWLTAMLRFGCPPDFASESNSFRSSCEMLTETLVLSAIDA